MKFVNDMVILNRETGGLEPRAQGDGGFHGKLAAVQDWIAGRMSRKPDLMLNDLGLEIARMHQLVVHRMSVWRPQRSLGLTHQASPLDRREHAA